MGHASSFHAEGYHPVIGAPWAQVVTSVPPPVVHAVRQPEEHIFHANPSEGYAMEEFQDQLREMHKEIHTLKGK